MSQDNRESTADENSQSTVDQLEADVRERDEAIASLTEYLEHTVKQMEQVKRSHGVNGALFDDEAVADQLQLVGELHRVVDEWDAAQTVLRVEHLAAEIDGLRTLIAPETVRETSLPPMGLGRANAAPPGSEELSPLARWEATQSGVVKDQPTEVKESPETAVALSAEPQELDVLAMRPPAPVADWPIEQWREAAESRDDHLISVIRTLRAVWARRRGTVAWKELNDAPVEQCALVEQREAELHQKLRTGEVNLSMERARLSREEMMLRQAEDEINKRKSRRGKRTAPKTGNSESPTDRRWLKFLGPKSS